eukprot:2951170-Pleurochrysis_carterae.AAC.1
MVLPLLGGARVEPGQGGGDHARGAPLAREAAADRHLDRRVGPRVGGAAARVVHGQDRLPGARPARTLRHSLRQFSAEHEGPRARAR